MSNAGTPDLRSAVQKPGLLCALQGASGDSIVYTVPEGHATQLMHGSLCNASGAAVTVSLALVPALHAADGTQRVVSGYSLAAGDTLSLKDYVVGATLGAEDSVVLSCSAASAVDIVLSGLEYA